jgi:hypothetical protein
MFARRAEEPEVPRFMTWDGSPEKAAKIGEWARDDALLERFQYRPGVDEVARVLTRHVDGVTSGSFAWAVVVPGARIALRKDGELELTTPPDVASTAALLA